VFGGINLSGEIEGKCSSYIRALDTVLMELKISALLEGVRVREVNAVVDLAKNYLSDAKHFLGSSQPANSLASVCYAEGLLDALRLLGLVVFKWPTTA